MSIYVLLRSVANKESIGSRLCLAVAGLLARLNAGYDDFELRGIMGEWTREEARRELQASIDVQESNRISGEFWSGIWGG